MRIPFEIPSDKPFDCVGLGLNAADTIITVPGYPPADGKVEFGQIQRSAGGQAASALAALSLWGMKTKHYTAFVGESYRHCSRY